MKKNRKKEMKKILEFKKFSEKMIINCMSNKDFDNYFNSWIDKKEKV